MSITVTNNSDGTFTVTCGTDSMIVGTPTVRISVAPGDRTSITFPPITPSGGAVTASIVITRGGGISLLTQPYSVENLLVGSVEEITKTLQSAIDKRRQQSPRSADAPLVMQYGWNSSEPLDIAKVSEILNASEEYSEVYCQIYFQNVDA